ncbi:hypothetical protein GCM10007094_10760 [Pseudovibrio japonicus]|uniref:Polysaccharide biosynthesis protein n=1 Tax=Pseudovibrio japonicus TaxID=366534 RepID=A0ABQ3E3F0_9HYPH|nr:hypothetical protein [Pseudovibrio japonicus]GHB24558.1 hypothetical protein GCM10007094_10760 [Pseudovibrio japonicus]
MVLLAYLAGFPPAYTAQYAVLAAYMQFATAPLNPYTEHFHLRERLSGRAGGFGAGIAGVVVLWLTSVVLVLVLGQSLWVLVVVPVLGIGHLLLKVQAAQLRANHRNSLAVALEFTLRPLVLLVLVVLLFLAAGPSDAGLLWSFGLTGLIIIFAAIGLAGFAQNTIPAVVSATSGNAPANRPSSPWAFVLLGMLMVLATQFEIFAMSRLADPETLASYKVALQLASVCGIATNFILVNNLRELYSHSTTSDRYRQIFRKVQIQTLFLSAVFAVGFASAGLLWPVLWAREIWLLAAAAAAIFAASAAFGPLANWFYSVGRIRPIVGSLALMVLVKLMAVSGLTLAGAIGPANLLVVYGLGVLTQNAFLLVLKARMR